MGCRLLLCICLLVFKSCLHFHYWCSSRGVKVGCNTSDILGSPFRVIKESERCMREESVKPEHQWNKEKRKVN